jgi:hypothetical protein
MRTVPALDYECDHDLSFTAYLYRDKAVLDGLSGHASLPRTTDAPKRADQDPPGEPLYYADANVSAQFGLGLQGRLARLDYTSIPEAIYCEQKKTPGQQPTAPQAVALDAPKPPPPKPDPNAPITTNLRTRDGARIFSIPQVRSRGN